LLTFTAPLLEAVEYYDYQFEAELGAENIYKGHPRPELDIAWDRIGKSELSSSCYRAVDLYYAVSPPNLYA